MKTDNHSQRNTVYPKAYNNASGKKVLEFISPSEIKLDLPFILTGNKRLIADMPYLKIERSLAGIKAVALRLIDIEVREGIIQLFVQELETRKTYKLEWNMEYSGSYWIWSLSEF